MVSYLARLAALAAVVAPAVLAAPTGNNLKISNMDAINVVPDSYIIVYHEDVPMETFHASMDQVKDMFSQRDTTTMGGSFAIGTLKGYHVTAQEADLAEIVASPHVSYVEKNTKVYASTLTTQSDATWGLGAISHKAQDSTSYIYDSTAGSGVTVYVVDTGIYIDHSEFGSRATWGANFVDSDDTDGNGHGTHCAGTIAGSTYGVAKLANLVAVKVLDANGEGSTAGVIQGISYVGDNAEANSVLSMSLGGGVSTTLNTAVRNAIGNGVTVVAAAGNDGESAAEHSPASEPLAITVGAIDVNNAKASWSNFGDLVDVFAPGVDILSAWIGNPTATNTISGTSMACPHIAGLAAYLIGLEGLSTPAAVQTRIKALGVPGVTSAGSGSPDLIAYNGNGA
ncbi:cuticle-degrading serine protease [Diplocarpon rosae]|nr:cuticle-degrading serine protease [Diplocarpon rosae]